ncbi:hypothetical protein [Granulosicoccus antarcticus]|uniref:Uncharacterized protein n=1 Tax=Granulosicoccus antarcticus IMCC3135 TaxID=1192854 RepID=A0A2Z2NH03_9GAMM|nr:hypothetical protein [Granulosicoccus antarcticus]ASJ70562.1 hypothetical protein IMCC3135_02240 [Granulosicoccus antarcticus IMCC3135]
MLPRASWRAGLLLSALGQALLLVDLVSARQWMPSNLSWLMLHMLLSLSATFCVGKLLRTTTQARSFHALLFAIILLMPVVGAVGGAAAFYLGERYSRLRKREPDYWNITRRAELPFTTPVGRKATTVDGRGFEEHLMYSDNEEDLYRKVLSAGSIQASLSVSTFKQAMRHKDERIRLTAYKMLDRKVSELNRQIQQLEAQVAEAEGREMSNAWLQIASNYWELLTLEKGEPIARQQLLDKAGKAAIQAVAALPINRNAHFVLGRVSLLQGDTRRANIAFKRARALGMPADKVTPYLAETAFMLHDFKQVRVLLQQLDPAIRAYPPLSHVAEYWA